MATLDDVATWCTSKMGRADMQTIAREAALETYLLVCARVPFPELQKRTSQIALTEGGTLDLTALSPKLRAIESVRYENAAGVGYRLRRDHTRRFDSFAGVTSNNNPTHYARFGETLEFWRPPTGIDQFVRVRYWSRPAIVAAPNQHTTTILLPDEWHALLKWFSLWQCHMHFEQYEKAMMLMSPSMDPYNDRGSPTKIYMGKSLGIIPQLWNNLLKTVSQMEGADEDFSIKPLTREYTNHG